MTTAAELRALASSSATTPEHLEKLRAHLMLAADALEAPVQMRDPWRDERHLFGAAYAKVTRILSRETQLEISIAGKFDKDGVEKVIAALRNAAHVDDRPLLSAEEIEHLRRIRHYFVDVAGGAGTMPADARDARRYRRLRVLGVEIPNLQPAADGVGLKCFQNLDDVVDGDIRRNPTRGEAPKDGIAVDWNEEAKEVLGKVIMLHALGQV